ncbi:amino acid adenylation domain-containing protein [Coleofasciculus sp.]|uniref:amino acid adenylation domain-containing protein n=1 Tax=Coleofasciculus sp. TaxID=3100458 RepID=UPI003A3544FA
MKNVEDIYPLSPMQQGILFHTLYAPKSGMYCEQFHFTIHGNLNISAFKQAWQQLIERHQVLRTFFIWEEVKEPVQVVQKQTRLPWEQYDWRGLATVEKQKRLEDFLKEDREGDFKLSQAPLIRLALIQLAEDEYQFIWNRHHLLMDGWSTPLIFEELFAFYKAFSQGQTLHLERPRPYRDYVAWVQQQDLSQAEKFWRQRLKGFTTATSLRVDRKPSSSVSQGNNYDNQNIQLSTAVTAALRSFAQQQQLTLNTLMQGVWALLLSRYSGESDVVFGAVMSGRPPTLAGAKSMVGMFINTLPVRAYINSEKLLLPWLKQIQKQQIEARQYEYSPLIEVMRWSDIAPGLPLFESILNVQTYPSDFASQQLSGNLKISEIRTFGQTHYPLTVSVEVNSELSLEIFYDRDRFDSDTISRMLGHFQTLLEGIVANPEQRLADLPILTEAERQQLLVEWNTTQADYPKHLCIHQLFETQVERTPDAIAIVFEDQQLTYRELNTKANQLAHHLQKLGVSPEVLVGLCVERSLEMVVGLLGILKAGGAYVPLDPTYPSERLAFMLSDSQAPLLLTQKQLLQRLPEHQGHIICLDTKGEAWEMISQENPVSNVTPENLAYVIYTSGSTGKPKGVQIPHTAVVNFLKSMECKPGLTESDTLLAVTSISFDIAALELYLTLMVGAQLVLVSREVATDGKKLSARLTAAGATVMQATPATWRMLLAAEWQGSSQLKILSGGEALPSDLAKQLLKKGASVWNLYGPTETTIWSTVHKVEATERSGALASIGRPIANTQIYLLDSQGQPVPIGIPGELHISGAGLARGYLNRPNLTADKFIPNSFAYLDDQPTRVYKTGDLARYLPDGTIEYLGRIDHQVKIRGCRIELGEIEAVLSQHQAVQQAVVIAREDEPGNQRLVAYLLAQASLDGIIHELRNLLEEKLPNYMMPSVFMQLEVLPLTPNGKIDRSALPAPDIASSYLKSSFVAPRDSLEQELARIWTQVLGLKPVGIYDNFFELGGHSLLATQVISHLRKTFKVELPLRCLFESPTIAGLAKGIQELMKAELKQKTCTIERVSRQAKQSLSFAQQRLWLLEQLQPNSGIYNTPAAVRLVGELNVTVLEQSFNEIVRRHEGLRTTFSQTDGQPVQVITPALNLSLPIIDICDCSETAREAEVQRLARQEAQRPFNLVQGPLLRYTLLRLDEKEHVLLFTIHHIVSDGWSIGVLVRELAALYEAFCDTQPSPLPELPIQYADFAVWQRQWLQGEVLEAQLAYWKQQLGGNLPVLQLPTVRPREEVKTNRGATQSFLIPANLSKALQALSHQEEVTLFMTLLAAFQVLLQRYTHQDDIVVGTDVANRNRAEIEPLIGFFVNLLVLRTDLSGNPSFRELLKRVREVALGAYAHQDLPFDKLVDALQPKRKSSHTPLFQVLFVLQNAPMPPLELPGLTLSLLEVDNEIARFDLVLFLTETDQGIEGKWQYHADLFEAATINRMSDQLETLLKNIVAQPDARINTLEMTTETEKEQQAVKKQNKITKLKQFLAVQPQAVDLSQERLIKTGYLPTKETLPFVIQPNIEEVCVIQWINSNQELIESELLKHGAILFRGFDISSVSEFERLAEAICPSLFGEYGDLPREGVSGKVYRSTPYPSEQAILFHNESSHMHCWPQKIWFFCVQPSQSGGETPIVDCRKIFQLLNPKLREIFDTKQLMYVRNYTNGLDVSWQDFFHTTDNKKVEDYCRKASIHVEWKPDGGLRTCQVRPAIIQHPQTGESVFFNQIQLHHASCLKPEVRESLLSTFSEDNLPRHVYYGDHSPIEDSVIEEIMAVYQKAQVSFPWQRGDVLMLDNMLTAHGRNPYVGDRKIVVTMGEMVQGA